MSKKEIALKLPDGIPESSMGSVIAYLVGLSQELADDKDAAFCEKLYQYYLNSSDKGDFVTLDEAMKLCGANPDAV